MALTATRAPDIILRNSIPLAATSDQPLAEVPRPPESASNDAVDVKDGTPKEISPEELAVAATARKGVQAEPEAVDDGEKPDPKAAKPEESDTADIPKDLPGYAVREISKVRKAAREARATAQAEADAARKEAQEAREAAATAQKALEELTAKADPPKEPEPKSATITRPTRDQFDDPDVYDDALAEWAKAEGIRVAETEAAKVRTEAEAEAKRADEAKAEADREANARQEHANWTAKVEKAAEKYPDFEDVVLKGPEEGGPTISPVMAMAIQKAENGTDVAYHLGQNTEESKRIAGLQDPIMQLFEMGRIAERLANPQRPRRPTPPIEPIDSGANNADTTDAEPDMDTYYTNRTKQLQQSKHPFFPPGGLH